MRNRAHSTSYLKDGLQAWACDPRHYGELASDDVYIILGKAAIVNRNGKSYQSDSVSFFWGQVTMHSMPPNTRYGATAKVPMVLPSHEKVEPS